MTIAAGYWPAAIDFMYSGRPKTRRSRRPVAAVFAPAAIGPPQLLVFLVVRDKNTVYLFLGLEIGMKCYK